MALINKKRAPRLRDRASLAASGIPCPYWYARADIILAIEAAERAAIEANNARRDHKAKVQQLCSLESVGMKLPSRTMEDLTKSSSKFYDCVDRIEAAFIPFEAILQRLLEIAREARPSLVNNPPDVFRRTFAELIQGGFQDLTGLLEPSWGPVFLEFCTAAWNSAELPEELRGQRKKFAKDNVTEIKYMDRPWAF
jgi:hypothetical protein